MQPEVPGNLGLPFSALSTEDERRLVDSLAFVTLPKGRVIYTQEISRVAEIHIITRGQLSYCFYRGAEKILSGTLAANDIFGGLSVLFNDHMAVHTLIASEECRCLVLDTDLFLDLSRSNPAFFDYFALRLGRCMKDKAFADVLARRNLDKRLNLPFFNQPVSAIFRANITTCAESATVHDAAAKMTRQNANAILVKTKAKQIRGIVSDSDIRNRAVVGKLSLSTPVSDILSTPVISISSDAQVFEAMLTMVKEDKRHLAVTGKSGDISGIISEKDLIDAQSRSTFLLIKAIRSARRMKDLENIHDRMERMLLDPIGNGANADYITQLITTFSDAIIDRVISFSIERSGPPPCKFVFLTMGSEGRGEQTLISDQDNAIIFEDIKDEASAESAKVYFDTLAKRICSRLDRAGYRFCEGDNMAQNPAWCQPLRVWKTKFKTWIRAASPEDLLHSSIFFDFRATWGDISLAQELKSYLLTAIGSWSGFLRNMTENAVYFKPPLGLFGKFLVETKGEYKDALDIKLAMLPIIDFARIYALQNGIQQTNTLTRLFRLYTRHALTSREYTDIVQTYNFLMGLRFRRQITAVMDEAATPDNYIYPGNLSSLDQIMLKETFKLIEKLQQKLNIEFTGVV
ncbi:MAG: DUF294 nucleotidyltransferase-like domain-containing protein [Desulfobacterales bacterium]|nr:DUF294 nucleotidyltransferase-like domain-containing protein [Desulfobacterales bacterium]